MAHKVHKEFKAYKAIQAHQLQQEFFNSIVQMFTKYLEMKPPISNSLMQPVVLETSY
jgi:hypothetical protein